MPWYRGHGRVTLEKSNQRWSAVNSSPSSGNLVSPAGSESWWQKRHMKNTEKGLGLGYVMKTGGVWK